MAYTATEEAVSATNSSLELGGISAWAAAIDKKRSCGDASAGEAETINVLVEAQQ